jgi:hypothetical protein
MLTRAPLLALTLGLSVAATACVVTTTDDDGSGGSGASGTTTNSTSSQGGAGGEGGSGGSTTNGTGGGGGAGGGIACIGHDGTGVAEAVCENDVVGGLDCGSGANEAPAPARLVCSRGFDLFTEGARENLIECLLTIPAIPADVCDEATADAAIGACIGEMYDEACLNEAAYLAGDDGICAQAAATCESTDPFPTAACLADLNVFSEAGVNEYIECLNTNNTVPCAEVHDLCLETVLTY